MKAPPIHAKRKADTAGATVRRFEMGASGMGEDHFLRKLGYEIKAGPSGRYYVVTGPKGGRAVKIVRTQLIRLLDFERVRAGLQPTTPGGGDEAIYQELFRDKPKRAKRAAG